MILLAILFFGNAMIIYTYSCLSIEMVSRERNKIKYSWKAEPRGPSQKKSRTLSDSVVLVNL